MARLPTAEIERIKKECSLLGLIESQGYQLKKRGKDYVMLCPFHEEKTPSFSISPAKNCYHCFGCGESGSVLDWVMKTRALSLPKAVAYLKDETVNQSGSLLASHRSATTSASTSHRLSDIDDDGQALLHQVVEFYHQQLLNSAEAQEWLIRRGLNHPELVSHFKLGYAGKNGISGILPSKSSREGNQLRGRLSQIGVLRESTKQDHFRGCVVMPIIGANDACCIEQRGKVLQLYGRRTQPDYKILKGSPKHLYLPSPLVGVWNESALVNQSDIILCEALIDAMSLWAAGYRNVISSYGVNGFTEQHRSALLHHGTKQVYIAYDRDEAGDKAAEKLAVELAGLGILAYRVILPKGMDVNEYACKSEMPAQALGLALEQKVPMFNQVPGSNPLPASPQESAVVEENISVEQGASGELSLSFGSRVWRIRGWQKNKTNEVMKINLQVRDMQTADFFVDTVDMYHAKQRAAYVKQAAEELKQPEEIIKRDLGRVLLKLEQLQDQVLTRELTAEPAVVVSAEAKNSALALLKSTDLINQISNDLASCGVVGESSNLLVGYLAAVSRKLDRPLAILIQSSSSAGKSSLMEAILSLMPEEERVQYSAMTGQSLFYLGETNLQHKILAIAEEEGVKQAAYALKLLQSDGELTIASTGKDEQSGELVTREYHVQGPVMLMLTTTAIDIDEELLNRCLVLSVNESREQTEAIHALQRYQQTLEGLLAENEKAYLTELHQNAQRLLRPINVVNPYAHQLTFLSDKTRTRRDHMKYLTLIQSIALLHQYQREIKTVNHRGHVVEYIEVSKADIALANQLAHDVLGRTLDEMPPQTRKLLNLIKEMVCQLAEQQGCKANEVRFTRRTIREVSNWTDNQLKVHCLRLVEMEYLLVHGGSRGHLLHYSLLWDGQNNDSSHLCGLLDVNTLNNDAGNQCKLDSVNSKLESVERKRTPSCSQVGTKLASEKVTPTQTLQGIDVAQVGVEPNRIIRGNKKSSATSLPASE